MKNKNDLQKLIERRKSASYQWRITTSRSIAIDYEEEIDAIDKKIESIQGKSINLQFSLKRKWFEMTKSGIKTEDYREINEYWAKRLVNLHKTDMNYSDFVNDLLNKTNIRHYSDNYSFKYFLSNTMTLGYPKNTDIDRILKLEHKGIEIRTGNPDWGAEEGKLYFVILHGRTFHKYDMRF